jgi:hypothetical protein
MRQFGPQATHQRIVRSWAFQDGPVDPVRAATMARLQEQFDDLLKRGQQMTRLGYVASGIALQERAFAVERQLCALENAA